MTPKHVAQQRARQAEQARALLKAHPAFAKANVEIYEQILKDDQGATKLGATKPGSDERLAVSLQLFDIRAEAYLSLVDNIQLQEAFVVSLHLMAHSAWHELTGQPLDLELLPMYGDEGLNKWRAILAKVQHWENEGFKRLMPKPSESHGENTPRRGYRDHIRTWMKDKQFENVGQAAKHLGVSESTLKSIMSKKGKARYGPERLKLVLKATGYKETKG